MLPVGNPASFCTTSGQGDPFTPGALPLLQYVLRGIKYMPKPASHIRLPITPTILRCLKAQWAQEVNHALSCMLCGGYRFLRAGKFRVTSSDELDP